MKPEFFILKTFFNGFSNSHYGFTNHTCSCASFLLSSHKTQRKEKKLFQIFKEADEKQGCKITRKQVFLQSAIGLDEKQQKLLFVHINKGLTDFSFFSLDGLKHCTVQIQTTKQNGSDMPDKVEFLLRFNHTAAKDEALVFF